MFMEGNGVAHDLPQAVGWLRLAVEQGETQRRDGASAEDAMSTLAYLSTLPVHAPGR